MRLKRSPFLHLVSVSDDHYALYHSLSMETAFLPKVFVESHLDGENFFSSDSISEDVLMSLQKLGLLIDERADGYEDYRAHRKLLEEPAINILYLLLTDACNMRCKYCYFLAPMPADYHPSLMTSETAIKALDFFARCVQKSIAKGHPDQHVVIYGGEPTINKHVLVEALRYIVHLREVGKLPQTLSVTINTNGILLDEEILTACKVANAIVAISIDGPKDVHDLMRVDCGGWGTFERVMDAYRLARDIGVRTGVCVTIDRHNISRMTDIVRWLGSELGAKGLGFNILINNGPCGNSPADLLDETQYAKMVANGLVESFKLARDLGIYEDRMMRRVKTFVDKAPALSDCGGCGLQAVISPEGRIGVCQAFCGEKKFFVSEPLDSFEPERHPYWYQWRQRSPLTNQDCVRCIALGNCGGGCPYNAYRTKGDINALDERFCEHAKAATHFLIQDLWQKTSAGT